MLTVILLLLGVCAAFGAEPWPLEFFTADPKAVLEIANKVVAPKDVDAIVIDVQSRLHIDEQGHTSQLQRSVSRVMTDRGVTFFSEISQVKLTWRKDEVRMRVRVITPDGQAHSLDPRTISEVGVPSQLPGVFTDMRQLAAPLPAVAKDSVIDVEIETIAQGALDPAGPWIRWAPSIGLPVAHLSAVIETPEANVPRVAWRGIAGIQRKEEKDKGVVRIILSASDLPVTRTLSLAPPEAALPEIAVSTVPSWQHVAMWYSGVVEQKIGIPSPRGESDPTDRIKEIDAILADIQSKVRYTGLELGMDAYLPHTPAETLERGYGDCKDKAVLLVNRLRAAGINSQIALVTPYPFAQVFPDAPGVEAFNHVIVYVPGKRALWIDPTSEHTPASHLPAADEGRLALIVDPKTTGLVRTPESTADKNVVLSRYEITLTEDGAPNILQTVEATGVMEDSYRDMGDIALQASAEQKTISYGQIAKSLGLGKVTSIDWGTPRDLKRPEQIVFKGEKYSRAGGSEQLAYAFISVFGKDAIAGLAQISGLAAAKDRTQDVFVPVLSKTEEHWKLIPPPGFRLKQAPQLRDIAVGPLTLQRKVSLEPDGSVTLSYLLENSRRRYSMSEVQKISEAWEKLSKEPEIRVDFVPAGSQLMTEGKWKEGIERLRKDAEASPKNINALLRYASALIQVGLRDKAIAICREAIQTDPRSPEAWLRLSFAYRHDPIGRMNQAGTNLEQAEKAIQTAIGLNPREPRYIAELALTKEWAPGGRFEDPGALAESARLLEGISKDLPPMGQTDALPNALLHLRQFDAGKQFYAREEAKSARADLKLAMIAAADGVADALSASANLGLSEDARKTTLRQAGQYLLTVGEYRKSAELFSAGSNASVPLPDVDLLRRSRRRSETTLSKNPVIATVQRAIYALLYQTPGPEFVNLMTPEWRGVNPQAERSELLGILTPYSRIAGLSLGSKAIAEIVVSTVDFTAEGSDELGYRVRFADPATNGAQKSIAWVVHKDGDYLILGFRADAPATGGHALGLAKRQNFDGARRWLDWQREEASIPSSLPDPLAGDPFFRLWPGAKPSSDSILAAAAALVARGPNYQDGIDVLKDVQQRAKDPAFTTLVDQALASAFIRGAKYVEAVPIFERLHEIYPASEAGFTSLAMALISAGKIDEAVTLSRTIEPASSTYTAALRIRAVAAQSQGHYDDAIRIFRELSQARNITASDWNNMAWVTLFASGVEKPNLEWAQKAVQLSQGRSLPAIQTLASAQAEVGLLKEARESILRYIGERDPVDPGTLYVMGRIAEHLGLQDEATAMYSKIPRPDRTNGVTIYDLIQLRTTVAQRLIK
jgi:tetratricopeptide (TPR) repeat protein